MTNETIARNYAATLFELAQRHEGLEVFADGMDMVVGLMDQNPSFRLFLETPRIADRDKKDLLKKVFEPALPRALLTYFLVIVDKRRQRLLGAIGEEFHSLLDEHLGRTHVIVTLARPLDPTAQEDSVPEALHPSWERGHPPRAGEAGHPGRRASQGGGHRLRRHAPEKDSNNYEAQLVTRRAPSHSRFSDATIVSAPEAETKLFEDRIGNGQRVPASTQ